MQKIIKLMPALLLLVTMPCHSGQRKITAPSKKAQHNTAPDKSVSPTPEVKEKKLNTAFRAMYFACKGDSRALNEFEKMPESEHILEPRLQALFEAERFTEFVKIYEKNKKKCDALCKKNYMIKAFLAQAYLATNKEEKAQELFQELIRNHGNDVQMCYFTAVGYLKTKRYAAAIKLLQDCIANQEIKSKHYLFHFLLSKAHLEANRPTEAMASIEQSIAQFPKFERGWLFKAILHEQQGKINEAIHGYKKFLDIIGRDQSIEKQVVQLLFNQQRYSEAAEYLKKLSADAPEYCFDLALVQTKSGNYTEALPSVDKVLLQNPTSERAKLLKIEILLNSEKVDEAVAFLQNWLSSEPNNANILQTFALLRQGGVPIEKLLPALEAVQTKNPTLLTLSAALGDLALDANEPAKALTYYEQLATQTEDKTLKTRIYYQRCFIMLNLKDAAALNAELTKAEQDDCLDHSLLNLKAFYYAQTNQQLDQALVAIDKALKAKPGQPAYLDTKAQVLQAMGKHSEALQLAQKAASLAPDDHLIKQHAEELGHHALQPSTSLTYTMRSRR